MAIRVFRALQNVAGKVSEMTLRIYADFNSGGAPGHGACWLLRYGPELRLLDEVAEELGLQAGMTVTLYYARARPARRRAAPKRPLLQPTP